MDSNQMCILTINCRCCSSILSAKIDFFYRFNAKLSRSGPSGCYRLARRVRRKCPSSLWAHHISIFLLIKYTVPNSPELRGFPPGFLGLVCYWPTRQPSSNRRRTTDCDFYGLGRNSLTSVGRVLRSNCQTNSTTLLVPFWPTAPSAIPVTSMIFLGMASRVVTEMSPPVKAST